MHTKQRWFMLAALSVALLLGACSSKDSAADFATVTDRDTVIAFVDEAVTFAQEQGRDAAFEAINDSAGSFQRGELYIYAYDFEGNVLAHGGDTTLVGKNLIEMTDTNGVTVIQALISAVRDGSGWVEYVWPNPANGNAEETKLGYARAVDDTWWLGSGTYANVP
jgi:cytochrome c